MAAHIVGKLRKGRGVREPQGLEAQPFLGLVLETESYCLFICLMTLGDPFPLRVRVDYSPSPSVFGV